MSSIVQICANNRYVLVCLEICCQPTLIAWLLYLVCSAIWSIYTARRYANAVHAVVVYLSVRLCVCVCVCHIPVLYQNG